MSIEKEKDKAGEAPVDALEKLSVIVDKLSAKVAEIEDTEAEVKALSPEEFRDALQKLDALGLTWTADRVPQIKPKQSVSDEVFLTEDFDKIREDYPYLPVELSAIVFHVLTGSQPSTILVGDQESLQKKAELVERFIITQAYKSEFFFKHAIKVPYLRDIDWEVVCKVSERNVHKPSIIPYALLSLMFLDPNRAGIRQQESTLTVAVDEKLVTDLIGILDEVRDNLQRAQAQLIGDHNATEQKELG